MTGYLVPGFGFGIVMRSAGFGTLISLAMSVFIYAGSIQYAAVSLLTGGASLFTAAIRFLPFIVFSKDRKIPEIILKPEGTLPFAVMGMLVIYCLKDISFYTISGFLPELISCAVVAVLHIIKRNTLISIVSGTLCYMLLVQLVF